MLSEAFNELLVAYLYRVMVMLQDCFMRVNLGHHFDITKLLTMMRKSCLLFANIRWHEISLVSKALEIKCIVLLKIHNNYAVNMQYL